MSAVYLVHEDYWNRDPAHRDPTMQPIPAETFRAILGGEADGGTFATSQGAKRIVGVEKNVFDNPWIVLLKLE